MMQEYIYSALLVSLLVILEVGVSEPRLITITVPGLFFVAVLFSLSIRANEKFPWRTFFDRAALVATIVGLQIWLLWVDFVYAAYIIPIIGTVLMWRLFQGTYRHGGRLGSRSRLGLLFSGLFFWGTISFGVTSVLGWQVWQGMLIFVLPCVLFARTALAALVAARGETACYTLLLTVIAAEAFAVISYLPFTEMTSGLLITLITLFVYDMLKYSADPQLIRHHIIIRKIAAYAAILALVLISTPWD